MSGLGEADTRAKLIDPAIHKRGWTEELIRREETAGTVEIHDGKPRRRSRGYVDYTLRIKINTDTQPVAVALIEAKKENLPPMHGLEQGKAYAKCKRLNVPFVISSNGHLFVEFDVFTGQTSQPRQRTSSGRVRLPRDSEHRRGEGTVLTRADERQTCLSCTIRQFCTTSRFAANILQPTPLVVRNAAETPHNDLWRTPAACCQVAAVGVEPYP